MGELKEWAFGICTAAIACGMVQLILPKSSMQRIFIVTSSVFFLGCLISPVAFSPLALSDLSIQQEQLQQEINERSARLENAAGEQSKVIAVESLRQTANETLELLNVQGKQKIYINVHDEGQGRISISECEVQLATEYLPRHDEIRAALMGRLGINVIIGYQDEQEE